MLTMKVYFRDHEDADIMRTEIFEVDRLFLKEFQTLEAQKKAAIKYGANEPLLGIVTTVHQIADNVDTVDHYLYSGYKVFVESDSGKTTMVVRY